MEKHIVNLKIEKESDLYCPYNDDHELNSEVAEYLLSKVRGNNIREEIMIRIFSKEPLDQERVRRSIGEWIRNAEQQYKEESKSDRNKLLIYFLVGLFFVALSLVLDSYIDNLMFTILSTIGSLAISESALIWLEENPTVRILRLLADKWLKSLDIEFILEDQEKVNI
ncbi:MAG: hypothetical protein IJI92_09185 [Erysipelotrichaceae bacterium]|nr:hypothetical protein [Erysipelotrichaceae bacterium]